MRSLTSLVVPMVGSACAAVRLVTAYVIILTLPSVCVIVMFITANGEAAHQLVPSEQSSSLTIAWSIREYAKVKVRSVATTGELNHRCLASQYCLVVLANTTLGYCFFFSHVYINIKGLIYCVMSQM
jgi:hypothetical protein